MKVGHKHPSNVITLSAKLMGMLGRRKVDPTTDTMRAYKGLDPVVPVPEPLEPLTPMQTYELQCRIIRVLERHLS